MKKFESLGRSLSKGEQKNIMGGPDESGAHCSTVCYNCLILSMYCSSDCTPNDHGIWCNGTYHECAPGNFCS